MMTLQSLRFFVCQCFCSLFKVINDGLQFGIPVFYDDSSIEALPFNNSTCSAYSKSLWRSAFLEPVKKQTVTVSLTTITIVTQIEHNVKVLLKEYFKDSKNGLFYFCVMRGALIIQFLNDKLKSLTSSQRLFFLERHQVMDVETGSKYKITIRGIRNLVWRLSIYFFKRKPYHNETMVPVSPIRLNSSSMRFSAARLISSERLKRANASS